MHRSESHQDSRVNRVDTETDCSSESVSETTPIPPPDWEALVAEIAQDMINEHSPGQILKIRAKLYDLLTHCIPATTVLKVCRLLNGNETRTRLTDTDSDVQAHAQDRRLAQIRSGQMGGILRAQDQDRNKSHLPPRGFCGQIHAHCRELHHGH